MFSRVTCTDHNTATAVEMGVKKKQWAEGKI